MLMQLAFKTSLLVKPGTLDHNGTARVLQRRYKGNASCSTCSLVKYHEISTYILFSACMNLDLQI